MKPLVHGALGAIVSIAGVAHAAQPVSLLLPVTYESDTAVLHKTKESCQLEDKLARDIGGEFQRRAGEPRTVSSTAGVVVRVSIMGSKGIGGGGWTGSKSLTVKAEQLKDGDVVRTRGFTGRSRGGLAGPFEGTCAILEGISETLAKDIVDWTGTETNASFDNDLAVRQAARAQARAQEAEGAASAVQ